MTENETVVQENKNDAHVMDTCGSLSSNIKKNSSERKSSKTWVTHILVVSDRFEPGIGKLETNLIVDLMLDLHFKKKFAEILAANGVRPCTFWYYRLDRCYSLEDKERPFYTHF